jgi:hypothetical protein
MIQNHADTTDHAQSSKLPAELEAEHLARALSARALERAGFDRRAALDSLYGDLLDAEAQGNQTAASEAHAAICSLTLETRPASDSVSAAELRPGMSVRAYGLTGELIVAANPKRIGKIWTVLVSVPADRVVRFSVPTSSIVELEGTRRPLGSLPIAPPASDYPHESTLYRPEPGLESRKMPESWKMQLIK